MQCKDRVVNITDSFLAIRVDSGVAKGLRSIHACSHEGCKPFATQDHGDDYFSGGMFSMPIGNLPVGALRPFFLRLSSNVCNC